MQIKVAVTSCVLGREAIIEAQQALVDQGLDGTVKYSVHPRLLSLPQHLDAEHSWLHPPIGRVRSAHAGRLLTVAGKTSTCTPATALQMLSVVLDANPVFQHAERRSPMQAKSFGQGLSRFWRPGRSTSAPDADTGKLCESLVKAFTKMLPHVMLPHVLLTSEHSSNARRFSVEADLAQRQVVLPVPKSCPLPDCKSTTVHQIAEESEHTDYQEIRVQEQAQSLSMGALPQSMTVILTDDLADSCRPGGDCLFHLPATLLLTS